MARKLSEQVEVVLAPFAKAIGDDKFDKVVLDVSSMLGRQTITTIDGEWKAGAGLKLAAKDQHKVQLPLNNPAAVLFWFAIRLNEIAKAGEFSLDASLPKACTAWIENLKVEVNS